MSSAAKVGSDSLKIHGKLTNQHSVIFTEEAMAFVQSLEKEFGQRRHELLKAREKKQKQIDEGWRPDFRADTKAIREGDWKVAPLPKDLQDRRVEITGPAEPKMMINALNSGAKVFMADIEDSLSPTWEKVADAQKALRDAVRRTLTFSSPEGKDYQLNDTGLAVLIVRPRGWHLDEKNITLGGEPISGSLLDFALYFFHNAKEALSRGTGPYFYIPKLESMEEAQLWADVFAFSEQALDVPKGTIKATILIETITAVFEMDEILHALKDYIVGLNCGRWDYIFSYIKKFHKDPAFMLPDRAQVTMKVHFLNAYSELLIQTCHKRGAFAMGGMAAAIPNRNDKEANAKAFAAVKADKEREVKLGHDGTWVAHPDLIPVALEAYDSHLNGKVNQLDVARDEVSVAAADLLKASEGTITEAGVRNNVNVGIQYMAAWLDGRGAVPIFNLMEDAATAEIARTQLWQWLHHSAKVDGTKELTWSWLDNIFIEELEAIEQQYGSKAFKQSKCTQAADMMRELVKNEAFVEFLTLPAYEKIS